MKYVTPILETERLILKLGTKEDFLKVYEYDFTKLRNIGGEFEYVKLAPEAIEGFETYALETDNVLDFILFLKSTAEPIGDLVYDRYDENMKSLEISVNLHPNYWRMGYMSEAILCSMRYIFENLDIENIIYSYAVENFRSKGLNDKLGFEYYKTYTEYYTRLDKDIIHETSIMSKDRFMKLYGKQKKLS